MRGIQVCRRTLHSRGKSATTRSSDNEVARTIGRLRLGHVELAKSEVAEGDVADVVDEDVLGFQVAASGLAVSEGAAYG